MSEIRDAGELAGLVTDASRIWLPGIVERVACFMQSNDVPCSLRLVNKATAAQLRGRPEYTTVRLSQPVPHHAFTRRWSAPGATKSLTRRRRQKLVCLAAASGSIPNLQVAVAAAGGPLVGCQYGVLAAAAGAGQLDVCSWILQHSYCVDELSSAAAAAARAGQRATVEFLLANGAQWDWGLAHEAAQGGHTALVDWLLLRRPEEPLGPDDSLRNLPGKAGPELFVKFAEGCSLADLQALHQRVDISEPAGRARWYARALVAAARSPTADWQAKVEWLAAAEPAARQEAAFCASLGERPDALDRLRWLRQRGYDKGGVAWQAACAGSVAALEFVLAVGIEMNVAACANNAAQQGRLEVLQLLLAHGRLRDPIGVAKSAAKGGHLSVLAWAVEKLGLDLPSIPGFMTSVASAASMELLAWLHERGCGWDGKTFQQAALSNCEAVLEWLAARGCPMGDDGLPYVSAFFDGPDPLMLRCLQRLGCPWGHVGVVFNFCRDSSPLSFLPCLVEAGCPVDWQAAMAAEVRGRARPQVVSWLQEKLQQEQQRL